MQLCFQAPRCCVLGRTIWRDCRLNRNLARLGYRSDGAEEAQPGDLAGEAVGLGFWGRTAEVVGSEVMIEGAVAQHMVGGGKNRGAHIFDRVCNENAIEHKLTKPYHPWTNGQAERMNRSVKDATIKAFHYPHLESLKAHVLAFVSAYNFAKHLKAIRWKTPFEAVCHAWTTTPEIFKLNPRHLIPGPNTFQEEHDDRSAMAITHRMQL